MPAGRDGEPSSEAVRLWTAFVAEPTPSHWYRAHNASIVAGYLEQLAREAEWCVADEQRLGRLLDYAVIRAEAATPLRMVGRRAARAASARG